MMKEFKSATRTVRVYDSGYIHDQDFTEWDFAVAKRIARIHKIKRRMTVGNEFILQRLRILAFKQMIKTKSVAVDFNVLLIRLCQSLGTPKEIIIGQFGLSSFDEFYKICAIAGIPKPRK